MARHVRTLVTVLATSAVIAAGLAFLPSASATPGGHAKCTIVGTDGPDTLKGTPRSDVICGLGGDDVIIGLGGDDVLFGGTGDDKLLGGPGRDLLFGGRGNDKLLGEIGRDVLVGGPGDDRLVGGPSDDVEHPDAMPNSGDDFSINWFINEPTRTMKARYTGEGECTQNQANVTLNKGIPVRQVLFEVRHGFLTSCFDHTASAKYEITWADTGAKAGDVWFVATQPNSLIMEAKCFSEVFTCEQVNWWNYMDLTLVGK